MFLVHLLVLYTCIYAINAQYDGYTCNLLAHKVVLLHWIHPGPTTTLPIMEHIIARRCVHTYPTTMVHASVLWSQGL